MNQSLFSTGMPRSGQTLLTKSLSSHKDIMMAMGPNIEIYRFYIKHLVKKYGNKKLKKNFSKLMPFQDYFGSNESNELLKLILNKNFNENFDLKEWNVFLKKSKNRIDHDSSDLLPFFHNLKTNTYKGLIINLIKIIKKARNSEKKKIIGFNESWNICNFLALKRSFKNSKFIILIRDPRAIWVSLSRNSKKRKELSVQLLSIARQFRKYIILSDFYLKDKKFKKKLLVLRFEDLIENPKKQYKKIFNFLNVNYSKDVFNQKNFFDHGLKKKWTINSAYRNRKNFDKKSIFEWKHHIKKIDKRTIEFLCQNEMFYSGYKMNPFFSEKEKKKIFDNISKDYSSTFNWRTDKNNLKKDLEFENIRNKILNENNENLKKNSFFKYFLFNNLKLKEISKYLKNFV